MKSELGQNKKTEKYDKMLKSVLPKEFNVLELVIHGKKVIADMKELMEIINTENKQEIISAMNKASTHYFYFSRICVDLEDRLNALQESFDIWMADKKTLIDDKYASSEKAKERLVIAENKRLYTERIKEIREVSRNFKYAEVAKKALEKNIGLIQSIGAMVRESQNKNPDSDLGLKDEF